MTAFKAMLEALYTPLWLAVLIGGAIFGGIAYIGLRPAARSSSARSNKRFLRRFSIDDKARIYLFENGQRHLLHGRICDISDDGAKMISPIPLNVAQALYVELPDLQLAGTATVRTCARQAEAYHIGLQFTGPLFRWFRGATPDAICYTAVRTDG